METKVKSLAKTFRAKAAALFARSRGAVLRTPLGLRVLVAVVLPVVVLAGIAAADGWLPARDTALYPLHWQDATSLPAHTASFVFAPSAPNIGYACATAVTPLAPPDATSTSTPKSTPASQPTREPAPTPTVVSFDAVYQSLDGGMTWAALRTPFAPGRACHVFVSPLDADELFVAEPATPTDDTGLLPLVWRSLDDGGSWQQLGQIAQANGHESVAAVVPIAGQLVAEVSTIGLPAHAPQLYATADDGKTWRPLATPVTLTGLYGVGTTLYAHALSASGASSATPSSAPLYRSWDAGATWAVVSPPFANVSDLAFVRSGDGAATYGAGLIPADTAYGSQGHQVIVSKDDGASWSAVGAPPTLGALDVVMLPDGTLLLQSQLQDTQPAGGFTAETFRQAPNDTSWKLIGIGPYVNGWQFADSSSQAGAGARLWATAPSPSNPARIVWADMP